MRRKTNTKKMRLTEDELKIDFNLGRGDKAFCLHCSEEIDVSDVLDNPKGDWCVTDGCDGGGWGIDLFAKKWWS